MRRCGKGVCTGWGEVYARRWIGNKDLSSHEERGSCQEPGYLKLHYNRVVMVVPSSGRCPSINRPTSRELLDMKMLFLLQEEILGPSSRQKV